MQTAQYYQTVKNYATNTQPSPPDARDIPFVPKVWPPSQFAKSLDLLPNVEEVEDQLSIGSCVANGLVSQCEWMAKWKGVSMDLSRLFLYTATLDFEGRLGEEGLYTRDAYKVAYKYGICPEEGPEGYPYDISKHTVRPPDAAYLSASKTRVLRYEAVVPPKSVSSTLILEPQENIDRIKSALNEGLPVGIALSVTESIFGLTGPWREHQYQGASQTMGYVGGHYMVVIGYDDSVGKFLVQNSWGTEWGDGGFGGLPYNIVNEMFFEAWIVRNFNGYEVPESPGIKFELINRFRIEGRIVPEANEIGKAVNIWMGARNPSNGVVFLRDPIPMLELSSSKPSGHDNWTASDGISFIPAVQGYILQEDNKIVVVQWRDISELAGLEIYIGYGSSPLDWKVSKICTIPRM